jgi:hypothetical protein
MTTWGAELAHEMQGNNDPGPIVAYLPDKETFDVTFDDGYGLHEGPLVLAFTDTRVYFPAVYDGMEWMGSAPRNPEGAQLQEHVGGE